MLMNSETIVRSHMNAETTVHAVNAYDCASC